MTDTQALEEAIIGCILINGELFDTNKGKLLGDHFSDPVCNKIYKAMTLLHYAGKVINAVMVITKLSRMNGLYISQKQVYELAGYPSLKFYQEYVDELIEIAEQRNSNLTKGEQDDSTTD